jgi:hypothetical protein
MQGIENHKRDLNQVSVVLADGGYNGKPFAEGVKELIGHQCLLLSAVNFIRLQ